MEWSVYMILCSDGTLYTGISNNVARRFKQHQNGQGAKYFRGRKPEKIVYQESGLDRAAALKRESAIKKLDRRGKWRLLKQAEESHFLAGKKEPA
ncbi:GIY-YIG nuclease family protein [methane-oxidizing endosymbiont of Gigantopelta aegis]|uniref:GIY-YIG nuclease family protein n=1 Tax=methane-oxidizing endosymbiont of Gigantopelta aegis TaxID=2794938 RepID=UPI0018DB3692|nr:GIY-YIG nuclease family protein [methane-oxidizing endosymbiont of Gigantopelta aegis]